MCSALQKRTDKRLQQCKRSGTRRDYRKCADFLEPIRDTPIHVIDTPLIAGIHDKAAKKLAGGGRTWCARF